MGLSYPAERDSLNSGERSVAALPDRGRVLAFTSAGGAKPIAGRGGLEGFTPPHHYRRGQRLLTDTVPSPAPARQRIDQVCGEVTVRSNGQ